MPRTIDESLLPAALRARRAAGGLTNGEYHRLLPSLPDAALCDHAEVYAGHCVAAARVADPTDPATYLHHFILPELVARLRGEHAAELNAPDPTSVFRRLVKEWPAIVRRIREAIGEQRRLASLSNAAFTREAARAHAAAPCRWGQSDLVYDGSIHHTITPELIRRVAVRPDGGAGGGEEPQG